MRQPCRHPGNRDLCARLERIADLLEVQHATPFRVAAYRRGAATVADLPHAISELFEAGGVEALEGLPTIGRALASLFREYVRTGHISMLDRLEGRVEPHDVLASIPGLGSVLAHRVHDELEIDTLEELECACANGRLAGVSGFGPRRVEAITASLAARLGTRPEAHDRPSVSALLSIDAEYRASAAADRLPRIAPRRFNPLGRAWLPVLHATRDGWDFTALYSNTARAHRLERTGDWVVIHAEKNGEHDQATVVTERRRDGPRRTIRGREIEVEELRASGRESRKKATG
jgi:DNA polymerase (family 10)